MSAQDDLKNRGMERSDVDARRRAVEQLTETKLDNISSYPFEPSAAASNVENMIGVVQIPLGFAGPVTVNGDHAVGPFIIPLATTEGALIASVSRGMSVITAAGGAMVKVFSDGMTRAPGFRVKGVDHAAQVMRWADENSVAIQNAVKSTTSHGELIQIEYFPNGRSLHMRFTFSTGDAMGMNMATLASTRIVGMLQKHPLFPGLRSISVSGNVASFPGRITVYNINGQVMATGDNAVSLSTLSKGVYILRATDGKQVSTLKVAR